MSGTRCFTAVTRSKYAEAGQLGVDAALHADLGGAELPRLLGAVGDLVERERVGVGVGAPLGERAEPAADVADVGEVDVAVDDVGDVVADRLAAQVVGQPADLAQQVALGGHQGQRVLVGQVARVASRRPSAPRRPRRLRQRRVLPRDHRCATAAALDRRPSRRTRRRSRSAGRRCGPSVLRRRPRRGRCARPTRTRRRAPATAARPVVRRAAPARRRSRARRRGPRPAGRATARPARTYSGCTVSRGVELEAAARR